MLTPINRNRILSLFVILTAVFAVMTGLLTEMAVHARGPEPLATNVSGVISADTTWTLAGSPYVLTDTVTVATAVTLTVEPGVIVMGTQLAGLYVSGHLEAVGTATEPITFTSAADTGAGEWYGIDFLGGDGRLEHTVVRYAGQYDSDGIFISGSPTDGPIVITDSVIANNLGYPITALADDLHRLQMSNVSVSNNMTDRVRIRSDFDQLAGDVTLSGQPGLDGYEISPTWLQVPAGITMTLQPGTTIMASGTGYCPISVEEQGHLEAVGTTESPVSFTSTSDSAPGQWTSICVFGSAHFDHAEFRYSELNLDIGGATGGEVFIENSAIISSSEYGASAYADSIHRLRMSDVTFSNNNKNRVRVETGTLVDNVTLTDQPGLEGYEINTWDGSGFFLEIPAGITLTMEAGTTLMMTPADGQIELFGHLEAKGTEINPVSFTSTSDSAPGQWNGIYILGSTILNHAHIRNADYGLRLDSLGRNVSPIIIQDSMFSDNVIYPIATMPNTVHLLEMSNVLFTENNVNRVLIETGTLVDDVTLTDQPGLEGYEIDTGDGSGFFLEIPPGITLTMEAGTTLMMTPADGQIELFGHLEAKGTEINPVSFTSTSDSASGQWGGIAIEGQANLNHVHIRNANYGLSMEGLRPDFSSILIQDSVLSDNAHYPIAITPDMLHKLEMSNVTFTGNNANRVRVETGTLVDNVTLTDQPGLDGYEIDTWDGSGFFLEVPTGITLTMEAGTTLMMTPADGLIELYGHLEAKGAETNPVSFTSTSDSAPGQWFGIAIVGTANLNHAAIRNGEHNLYILDTAGDVLIANSIISQASADGLTIAGGKTTAVCTTFISNAANAVYVDGAAPDVFVFSSSLSGNGNGINNASGTAVDAGYNWWGDATGPGGDGPGSGDTVLGDVLYDPWLTEPTCLLFDLAATQTTAADPILAGETLTYTAVITNHGVEAATAVTLTVQHSANAAFVGSDSGVCVGTTAVNCNIGAIPAGTSATFTYALQLDVAATGIVTSAVMVTAAESEPLMNNNTAAVETAVAPLPTVGFSETGYSVYEDALTATVTVTLDVAPVFTVTVDYEAVGGTAVPGSDYVLLSGTLAFSPGVTAQTIPITVLDDDLLDGHKAFVLQLSRQTKALLASENVELTILDDEMRYQQFLPLVVRP